MKHIFRILAMVVALVAGLATVSAQTVTVTVRQKVANLPATASNYLDDPFRYFDIQLFVTGAPADGLEVFFDVDYSLDTGSSTEEGFYIRTDKNKPPTQKITLKEGLNIMGRAEMLSQLSGRRKYNIDFSKPLNAQLLPEGTYTLCIDVYRWSDKDVPYPNRVKISDDNCPSYDICYSGSAPELVSPMSGAQMALNGAMIVSPARKVNFFWTPVISNCVDIKNTRFKYKLKVVKVLYGQNYRDAIKYNPTVFSAEVRNSNFAVFDTLRDVKVQMEKGALYVAQVQAEPIKTSRSVEAIVVSNNGNSQPMPFYWCQAPENAYNIFAEDEEEEGEESEGIDGLTQWEGGVEEVSGWETISDEMTDPSLVLCPKRHYVESDGYYSIPMTDDIEVGFVPAQHESLKDVTTAIKLYENVDGGVDSITAREPLFTEKIEEVPEDHEMASRTLVGWGAKLKQGARYYMELSTSYSVSYWNYSISDTSFYVNERLADHKHDTISRDFVEEELKSSDGVFFRWGDDPEAPDFATPQWKAPVDRTADDIYDPESYEIPSTVPEIKKAKSFSVSWTPVKNVAEGDEVEYEVNVYELKPGQTLEEAVSENDALVTRTVTNATEISEKDKGFFKVFSSKKTYVMTLSTNVDGENNYYHFVNGNEALPVVIKIVK